MTVQVGQYYTPSVSVFMPLLCSVTFWCQSACKDTLFALIVVIWLRFTRFEESHNWDLHFPLLPSLCLCVHVWSIWFVLRSKVRSGKEWTHSLPPLWIATTYHLGAFPQYHHLLLVLQLVFNLQSLLPCIHSNLCSRRGGGSCIHSFLDLIQLHICDCDDNICDSFLLHSSFIEKFLWEYCSYWSRDLLSRERNILCKMVKLYVWPY